MSDLEDRVRTNLAPLIDRDADRIDLDRELAGEYGLTSLNLVVLVTTLCDETGVPVFSFTDNDLANLRTSRDVVTLFAAAAGQDA